MIREHFFPRGLPLILAGDFNEPPESPVYRQLLEEGSPLEDSWRAVHKPGIEETSQHNFDGSSRGSRIDWILLSPQFRVRQAFMVKDHQTGRYPSDHYPYAVEAEY
jgi:endonuclease/exonuclease/phosphatase family metal-dependent hydrolase